MLSSHLIPLHTINIFQHDITSFDTFIGNFPERKILSTTAFIKHLCIPSITPMILLFLDLIANILYYSTSDIIRENIGFTIKQSPLAYRKIGFTLHYF